LLEVGLMLEDFTERRVLEEQLAHQAFHDPLTGLPNRVLLTERLGHALARAWQKKLRSGASGDVETIALLFIDLDNFKRVNDSLGHQAGDQLLIGVAERVGTHLRPGDTFARFGGDEFAVLLDDGEDESGAMGLAERIVGEMRAPFLVGGEEVFVTASIGIVLSDRGEVEGEELLRRADVAMYQSKRAGKDRCALFFHDTKNTDLRHLKLDGELRKAIEAGELRLHYQPTVLLETGEITGFEALVRWEHPQHGLLPPAQFIPLAEESGMIIPLGQWVLTQACRQARVFRGFQASASADTPLKMFVNLSAGQFRHPALVEEVIEALSEADLEPRHLVLEITESVAMESYSTAQTILENLKRLGTTLAMDDFGTGQSSLVFLKKFPVDILKIDRSMVGGVAEDPKDAAIVRAITTLAHTLGLTTVAEGVETAEELQMLRSLGCVVGQGYYWLRPSPASEAMGLLAGEPNP
jgi:diguanylate cyclase (GGDEF)-like protein